MQTLMIFVATLVSMLSLSWTIPFIILQFIFWNFKLYIITESGQVALILKKLPKRSSVTRDGNISCWIWGWKYIGYISDQSNDGSFSREIYLYTTNKHLKYLTSPSTSRRTNEPKKDKKNVDKIDLDDDMNTIKVLDRCGAFSYLYYLERDVKCIQLTPKQNQRKILDIIISHYNNPTNLSKTSVIWLYGPSGVGKSTVSILLTNELEGIYCDTFNPTDPGDTLQRCYNSASPSEDNPLILVIDEADLMFSKIHNGKIVHHAKVPVSVKSKGEINSLFDKVKNGLFPYMIIIMTSNVSPRELTKNQLENDESYLRDGRIDLYVEMTKKNTANIITPTEYLKNSTIN